MSGICELNGSFAKITNRRLERTNHLFGRRFWSELIEDDDYLLAACRYVLLNPERAGAIADARCWRWSSLAQRHARLHPSTQLLRLASSSSVADNPPPPTPTCSASSRRAGLHGQLPVPGTE